MKNEKELKTLKDFWGIYPEVNSNKHIDVEELKAEAVKWVKYAKENKLSTNWKKMFFNFLDITEEDLK